MSSLNHLIRTLTGLLVCWLLVSCNAFSEGEGDCGQPVVNPSSGRCLISFRYDWNLKMADAFAAEVEAVTLYVIRPDGTIAWNGIERGEALKEEDYAMSVEVEPGTYDLIAWCTTNDQPSYTIGSGTQQTQLSCTLNRKQTADGALIDYDLDALYYGRLTGVQLVDEDAEEQRVVVPLMKDTNRVRVALQHTSGAAIEEGAFVVTLTDNNGSMNYLNEVLEDETLTYQPWHITSGSATVDGTEASGINVWMAEFAVGRLMNGAQTRITVTRADTGETVFSVPLIDYALLLKGYDRDGMDDQEYLDRQDEYNLTFFLDGNNRWINTYIYINSWRIVLHSGTI